ncbi:extracellular solute-binding protein [Priestia endophytica]|jgi:iron(III) transport system substrate-binding protein|uniref:extracellular solute-binding protein n=1 Tax=Priestia endophytica TaxID=135735 RepID=UPI00203A7A9C|nr:extracellular solute-binding protein [Priestia endophytica]MCM3541259.1 extracellular solute-binding protein [Priestia endophytica]
MRMKKRLLMVLIGLVVIMAGCGAKSANSGDDKVVIYSNGDEEAITAMEKSLKDAGYEGKYIIQSLGTSELGGKLVAEGDQIEADLVTMSSYFLESAEKQHSMFKDLAFETKTIDKYPAFYTPILANTGAVFFNTEMMKQKGLDIPKSIKGLASPEYKGLVSIPNIMDSSTGWMLIQAIISEYGEEEGKKVMAGIIKNAGPHLESSGSGSIKKVQAGEVAVGFGLRHQAVEVKQSGAPIDFIDPVEGNFSNTESLAVINKKDKKTELAMDMAKVIVEDARAELINYYPVPLYEGETVDEENKAANNKVFKEPMTVELLEKHQAFFNSAK